MGRDQMVFGGIGRNPVEPSVECRFAPKRMKCPIGLDEGLLGQISHLIGITDQSGYKGGYLALILAHQDFKSPGIALDGTFHQNVIAITHVAGQLQSKRLQGHARKSAKAPQTMLD